MLCEFSMKIIKIVGEFVPSFYIVKVCNLQKKHCCFIYWQQKRGFYDFAFNFYSNNTALTGVYWPTNITGRCWGLCRKYLINISPRKCEGRNCIFIFNEPRAAFDPLYSWLDGEYYNKDEIMKVMLNQDTKEMFDELWCILKLNIKFLIT